jgi:magnesium-transporting ATPase (P-type)
MGMYDEIVVKQNLPIPEVISNLKDWKNYKFQTKDLDNCLSEYWISEDGELFEHIIEREYIPYTEEERKNKNHKPWDIWKDVIEKGSRDEKINYHGVLTLYTYDELDDDTNFWIEIKAYFIYGKLDKIESVEFKLDKDRKAHNKQWEEEYKRRSKHPWNVFKHYASYVGWRWFWRKISNLLYKFSKFVSSIQFFINRYIV